MIKVQRQEPSAGEARRRPQTAGDEAEVAAAFWALPPAALVQQLSSGPAGLAPDDAAARLARDGPNVTVEQGKRTALALLARQFAGPLVLMLLFAAVVSAFVGEIRDAIVISLIVVMSGVLGFSQEYRANRTMAALRSRIAHRARVLRGGAETVVAAEALVAGDVVLLAAGDLIAVDGVVLEANELQVSEGVLTGESFPVAKSPGCVAADAPVSQRTNAVFAGTSVRSGTGRILAVATGPRTEFARIASSLERAAPETEFTKGLRSFGYLMLRIVVLILFAVFVANLLLHRPLIDSLLFSMALSVGLTPELLPAIVSVTLARGAHAMARGGVIVRRLHAIESLGSMDVLCTDKTGTLTEGVIRLDGWVDEAGAPSARVLLLARLNACLQTGMANPLDEAIAGAAGDEAEERRYRKLAEIPYDFTRKSLSVLVTEPSGGSLLIAKGAVDSVLARCGSRRSEAGPEPLQQADRARIDAAVRGWSNEGCRVLAVATRDLGTRREASRDDESAMCLEGFLLFKDPPKAGVVDNLAALKRRGIAIKIVSGDNRHVSLHLAEQIGLHVGKVLTGPEIDRLTGSVLAARVEHVDLFAEIDPNQKERIIRALRRRGHVVGYLGDGINDAPALHEADIGISVDTAVDVAREAADMILLEKNLGVLARGVDDGRAIFANTMKYVFVTTSANFGNMTSMALASAALPFLPMLAKQILLNNLLSDVPCLAIATDRVDASELARPRRWDIASVRRSMFVFGLLSSAFDVATFAFLLWVAGATASLFQTGWFVESLLTELAIIFVLRTRNAFWASRPSRPIAVLAVLVGLLALALPYLPFASLFDLEPLPLPVLGGLLAITSLYVVVSEWSKQRLTSFLTGAPSGSTRRKPKRGA